MLSRPISLVPVTLREAALDSPTFRGTVVHYGEQVELVEKWLEGYLKATLKLCSEVNGLEEVVNNYLGKGVLPNGISESIIDQDYTLLAIRRFAEGSRGFWGAVISGAKKVEQTVVEPLLGFQRSELRVFKDSRRSLETTQAKYDSLLARYAGLSKSKEPSSLREDAFQLYEARKLYIRACLDFCVAAPIFRASLDRTLTKVLSDQSRKQIRLRREGTAVAEKYAVEMDRIRAWSEGMEQSDKVFRKELLMARKELEERVKRELHPARELEEYASSTVPYLSSKGPGIAPEGENIPSEKQGWLFMRTLTGKPTRSLWIRRWFFVREGIFGWLMQGYKGGAMEESEKIGVLLCNIKPAFQEERRFCFEVKTKDTTILLQSETQAELTSWLTVFEQAKRTAVESASSTASTQAFSIIPPSAPVPATEPAYITKGHDSNNASSALAPQPTGKDGISLNPLSMSRHLLVHRERGNEDEASGIDRSLTMPLNPLGSASRGTSFDISRNDNSTPMASGTREKIAQKLDIHRKAGFNERNQPLIAQPASPSNNSGSGVGVSALISASHNALPFHPPASPPTDGKFADGPTSLAPATLASTPAPVALSKAAMITSGQEPINDDFGPKGHRKTQSLDATVGPLSPGRCDNPPGGKDEYPSGYPPELRAQDNHFRALFPGRRPGDVVLLVFRATWSPNDTQELPGRCYVTVDNVYFYSHYLGLVFTSVIPLTSITEVKAAPGKDCDYLFLHLDPEDEAVGVDQEGREPHITVKIFLEPVRLLQRRLLFLVKNANTSSEDEPPKLPARRVLERLIALEREVEERTGTDTESWEDVGFVDAHDELERRKRTGELVRVRIDGDMLTSQPIVTQRGIDGRVREVTRFKLPSVPVIYEPEGMDKKAFEREFEVSPKAMFHVMFGDRSAVFQTLYHERRARYIQQGAWTQREGGRMKREFRYQIEYYDILRRLRISNVVDYQTVEKQDDHLCYVITDRKTPWHLPHREHFMLVSKVVITHVAKSKCKLSIWTAVEWAKEPTFSKGIVHRQALDDLDLDALDLGDVVADQARKLGSQSRIESAVRVFGGIGQEPAGSSYLAAGGLGGVPLASDLDPRAPRLPIAHRSLSQMMLETGLSFLESAVSSLMMWTFTALQKAWGLASAQRIILLLLAASLLSNTMLSSRSTVSYWNERRAAKFMNAVGVSPNGIMSRAVYLKDMDEIVLNGTDLVHDSSSQCYAKFRELASFTDMDADAALASKGFSSASTRATARRLRLSRQHLGSYRHDLLVAMRLVNSLERDMVHAEWDNWLFEETSRCKQALFVLNSRKPPTGSAGQNSSSEGDDRGERNEVAKWLSEYCDSCNRERSESDTGRRLGLAFP